MGLQVYLTRQRHPTGVRGTLRVATTLGPQHELTRKKKKDVVYTLEIRLAHVTKLVAVDPYPALRVDWKTRAGHETRTFHPLRLHKLLAFEPDDEERTRFAEVVRGLLETFEREIDPKKVDSGWLAAPHVPWEKVEDWPVAEGPGAEQGAYRTAQVPIVARRGKPSPYEALLTWLASSPERPWRDTAREMVLTPRQLFVRHWNRQVYALPRDSLRTRLDGTWEGKRDSVYVFGQRTFLVVPHRDDCEVATALDRQLAGR